MKSGRARNSAGLVSSTLTPWATEACMPIVPLALWMMARSTIEMKGLTIMLAAAAEATSLTSRAASTPRAPTRAKRLVLPMSLLRVVAVTFRFVAFLAAKKPRAAVAPAAAAATAATACAGPDWSNRGAVGTGSLLNNLFLGGRSAEVEGYHFFVSRQQAQQYVRT